MRTVMLIFIGVVFFLSSFTTKKKLKLPEEFALIPGGSFSLYNSNDPFSSRSTDSLQRVSLTQFYMSKYEVSNEQYRQFFTEVSVNISGEEKEKIACDTAGWNRVLAYSAPITKYYYSHPAYNNYPVVNVSYDGALKYCEWLQKKLQNSNAEFDIEVKLPSKAQWIWAAMGGRSQAMFPWDNYYLRNNKDEPMCNFKKVNDVSIYRNRKTGKPEVADSIGFSQTVVLTASVKSFYPNDFGLYNMCGNAAEIIEEKGICMGGSWNDYGEDIHIRSEGNYEKSSPTVGFRPMIIARGKKYN